MTSGKSHQAPTDELSKEMQTQGLQTAVVADLHSISRCEDGKTMLVMIDMADGSTVTIAVCPGEPIRCGVHGRPGLPDASL